MKALVTGLIIMFSGTVFSAADLFIYPKDGQGEELQRQDRYECHVWAAQQSGFDPSNYKAPQPVNYARMASGGRHSREPELNPVTGAAGGAAAGAVGGAIAGNAGKGAAIGAGVGAVIGAFHTLDRYDREQRREAKLHDRQAAAADEAQLLRQDYNRAISACLEGRGYSVK